VKLLFDQNLSPRLVDRLADAFPQSTHVANLGLGSSPDMDVWEHAAGEGYVIVARDADFAELSLLRGAPPKVIWIRRGDCTTGDIERVLRDNAGMAEQLGGDPGITVLVLH